VALAPASQVQVATLPATLQAVQTGLAAAFKTAAVRHVCTACNVAGNVATCTWDAGANATKAATCEDNYYLTAAFACT
jgi:hypothetical protein